MTRALFLSVRFHDDRYHGIGDWPPSPARLFQALVAASPALDNESRDALVWLEQQDAPTIAAPVAHSGQHVSLFVPNNDLDAKGGDIRRVAEIRGATKHIRPRLFDASVPLLYVWRFAGDEIHAERICSMAEKLYQLGRGVDMAWATGEILDEAAADTRLGDYPGAIYTPSSGALGVKLDCPDEGSLVSLDERYKAGATRFRRVQDGRAVRTEFANAPRPRFRSVAYDSPAHRFLYELRRTTASGSPFAPWPLVRAGELVQIIRGQADAQGTPQSGAAKRLADKLPGKQNEVTRVFIGRDAKEADKVQRLRIIPLPSIGHVHVDRGIRRVLLEVPPDCSLRADDVAWAFSGLEIRAPETDEDGVIVSSPVELVRADDDSMLKNYGIDDGKSWRLWRSITPLALPTARRRIDPAKQRAQSKMGTERLKEQQQACHEVAQALRHAGLRHRIANLHVQREPFDARGECAETFAVGTRFSRHQLWHVEIEFSEPAGGPLVLGSGRYLGLGVMAPVRENLAGVFAFSIVDGLSGEANSLELARALRRAVMARVQDEIGKRERLPVFFTGHEADGAPARSGAHAHLAFVPDLERKRLLVIAPHIIEHRERSQDEGRYLDVLARALTEFEVLRAGPSGKLRLTPETVDRNSDSLFAASTAWVGRTPYVATWHAKRNGAESLQSDVLREVQRRGLPVPKVSLNGKLSLKFAVAVPGPVLLGKNMHYGGGLFAVDVPEARREY